VARLASQIRAGFYPAPEKAIAHILRALDLDAGDINVLDPCAGKGAALRQVVDHLNDNTEHEAHPWAMELEESRGRKLVEEFGKDHVLAPADTFNCQMTAESVQLLWLNPPYDDELGGGGTEVQFLNHAWWWLATDGVIIFVVPEKKMGRYAPCLKYLHHRCDNLKYTPFPEDCRKFGEAFYIGTKRKYLKDIPDAEVQNPPLPELLKRSDMGTYKPCKRRGNPRTFTKTAMTPNEMAVALATSPLQRYLKPPAPISLARPPLPLRKGHTAVLLSAGHLNGVVRPKGEKPHVIRGSCMKEMYLKDQTTEERDDGSIVTRTTEGERFILSIRALTPDGTFHDLKNNE
jgi:hypothetical protein